MRRFALIAPLTVLVFTAGCFGAPPPPTPSPTPTSGPVVASPPPLPAAAALPPLPSLAPTLTPAPARLYVANSGGEGVTLRREPGGDRLTVWPDGTEVQPLSESRVLDGRSWTRVRDPNGDDGWMAAEFLVDAATYATLPTSAPRPTTALVQATAQPGPTAPLPLLRPTFTPAPAAPPAVVPATPVPAGPTAPPKPGVPPATPRPAGGTPPTGPTAATGGTPPAGPTAVPAATKPSNPGITPVLPPLQR